MNVMCTCFLGSQPVFPLKPAACRVRLASSLRKNAKLEGFDSHAQGRRRKLPT